MGATIAWDKMLLGQGFGTRKACRALVEAGRVAVAGAVVDDWRQSVATDGLHFTVDGIEWRWRAHWVVALHKPVDIECSRKPSHHPSVMSLLPAPLRERGVQPVGRLDHDTTGLLLLSDDGAFIHAMSSPRRDVPKVYVAQTFEPVTTELLAALRGGVQLHDEPAPLAATHCVALGERTLEIVVAQGKYHQVKRMLAAAGNHCTALCRTAIGGLRLDALDLAPGQWCELDAAQRATILTGAAIA